MTKSRGLTIAIGGGLLIAVLGGVVFPGKILPHRIVNGERQMMSRLKHWLHRAPVAVVAAASIGSAQAAAPPPTTLGIDLSPIGGSESLANLVIGPVWSMQFPGGGWVAMPAGNVDEQGELKSLPTGATAVRALALPNLGKDGVTIRCTFTGKATVWVSGPAVKGLSRSGSNSFTFRWATQPADAIVPLNVRDLDPGAPVRNLDCRRADISREIRFTPEFLTMLKGFRVLRFMDWQATNVGDPVSWATRHTPQTLTVKDHDGVSVEDMVALAALSHTDAWFNMPWRADDDYVRHFAQYVHDTLPRNQHVYVELGNEVWNGMFPVTRLITQQGIDERLGASPKEAAIRNYGRRLIKVMDIWKQVFADNPGRLIRVASGQSADTYRTETLLAYPDLPKHVDAFATAPYFYYDNKDNPADVDQIYQRLTVGVDKALAESVAQKAIAARYGLRYVAYEAGQGIVLADIPLAQRIQRDPRMYDLYRHYISGWRTQIGDTMMLFGTVFRIRRSGAWGLLEYDGQPAAEAPKFRAVQDELSFKRNSEDAPHGR
jgi:hypothetical protein